MDLTALEELGLSHAEAIIYVALLSQGPSTTGSLIKSTKMQSSTVYHTLGALLEKGAASYILRGKIKYFQAEKPEIFLSFWEDKKQKFNELLPLLKQKEKKGSFQSSARIFEGLKGMKAAYDDVLESVKPGEITYLLQPPRRMLEANIGKLQLFYRQYHLKRSSKGIILHCLTYPGTEGWLNSVLERLPNTEIRFIPEIGPSSILIYADKVLTMDFSGEPIVFVLESKATADSYRKFFESKWKNAKKA